MFWFKIYLSSFSMSFPRVIFAFYDISAAWRISHDTEKHILSTSCFHLHFSLSSWVFTIICLCEILLSLCDDSFSVNTRPSSGFITATVLIFVVLNCLHVIVCNTVLYTLFTHIYINNILTQQQLFHLRTLKCMFWKNKVELYVMRYLFQHNVTSFNQPNS